MAKTERYYGTGRRKKSIARVYLTPGKGEVTINKRSIDDYFGLETLKVIVRQPFAVTGTSEKFDVLVNVRGVHSKTTLSSIFCLLTTFFRQVFFLALLQA